MSYLPRVLGPLTFLICTGLLLFGGKDAPLPHAGAQMKGIVPPPPSGDEPVPPPAAPKGDAFTLPLERANKQKLEAAEDYIHDQKWNEVVLMLQAVLDTKEDSFFLIPADPKNHLPERWTSARAEAERLLANLPPAGREFYQLATEPRAQQLLKEAIASRDPQRLPEIVRRYLYTNSGAEALEQLGSYHLDRGQMVFAAVAFQRRLERAGNKPEITPLTLFKALLAFHAVGDKAREQDMWNNLNKHIDRGGLRIGAQVYSAEQLRAQVARMTPAATLAGASPLFRGDPARTGRGSGEPPYLDAQRHFALTEMEEGREWLKKAVDNVPPGVVSLPGFSPITFGDKLIYRSYGGVHAFDIRAGKELWRRASPFSMDAALRDPGKKVQMAHWFSIYRANRNILIENTINGTLSSDGQRVYAVEDLAVPPPPEAISLILNQVPRYFGPFTNRAQPDKTHNTLRAINVDTGEVDWEIGGFDAKTPAEVRGVLFLGPPLPLGNSLFAVVEQKQELRLLCLAADTGAVLWEQPLGLPRDKILLDLTRRTQALHLAYADGILVCPTGAGGLIGIDPLTHNLLWAHNYRDRPQAVLDPNQPMPEYNLDTFQSCWKHCAPIIHEGRIIFTAPDSDSVRCLNLRTGSLAWKVSRTEDDLYLGAVSQSVVLLVGKDTCRALNLTNGDVLWQQQTGRASGEGVLAGRTYYVPLKQGAIYALDLEKPRESSRIEARGEAAVGNLLFHAGDLWSQTERELTCYPRLSTYLQQVDAQVQQHENDPAARLQRGELRLDRGDLSGAIADLRRARELNPKDERTRRKLHTALAQLLQHDFSAGEKYLDEFRALSQVEIPATAKVEERARLERERLEQQVRYCSLVALGRERQGRLLDAVQVYRDLYQRLPADVRLPLFDEPGLEIRGDLWIQAQIAALVQRSAPEAVAQWKTQLELDWKTLSATEDLDAVARFAALFGALKGPLGAPGREARLRLAEEQAATASRRQAVPLELELLALQQEADSPALAARALYTRGRLFTRHGQLDDALAVYRTLAKDYPEVKLPGGCTPAALLNDLATDKRFLAALHEVRPAWNGRKMQPKDMANGGISMNYVSLAVDYLGDVPPSTQRWRFLLDSQKWQLHVLDRDTMLESWSVPVPPVNLRLFGGLDPDMYHIRVVNHLAFFTPGSSLVAIDLIERRVRWTCNFFDEMLVSNRGFGPMTDGSFQVVTEDQAVYRVGLVGPITAATITVQTRFGLTSLDSNDGRVRWQRPPIGTASDVFGDEQHVYIVDYQSDGAVRGVRAVRVRDGQAVAIPDAGDAYAQNVRTLGRHILVREVGAREELSLRLYDVFTGKDVWRKTLPKESLLLDSTLPELAATVTPRGEVSVFDIHTGKELRKLAIKPAHMDKVKGGTLLGDDANYYVALTGPIEAQGQRVIQNGAQNSYGDLHFVPVNGMVYAFDRDGGAVKWSNRVVNQQLLVTRFAELPVLLFATDQMREIGLLGSGQQSSFLVVRSIDKPTGKRLFSKEVPNSGIYHTLWVDPRSGIVDLISDSGRLRHQVAKQ
jgi:outer membrane protein assembly factor BamB